MTKQYWLGEFFVDLSRNQISQHTQSQTLPPKALAVLTHLAENQGKVVTYDELLDKVWPNAVVTPNTLQRSIAQLRKALGENSKIQEVIKTHAKQGYSLECNVTWFEEQQSQELHPLPEASSASEFVGATETSNGVQDEEGPASPVVEDTRHSGWMRWGTIAVLVCAVVLLVTHFQKGPAAIQFSDLRYMTATDDKEYGALYSPDGHYILFNRYFEKLCINHIMAKDTLTMEEFQLTAKRGTYTGHTLSPDGKTLAFIQEENCTQPVTQKTCYRLMSLDFQQGLTSPQEAQELLRCENTAVRAPTWMDNESIAMMQHDGERWRLIRFSVRENMTSTLYSQEGGNILAYAYSAQRK